VDTFDALWESLIEKLHSGTKIPNWTAYSGHLGDYMVIDEISRKSIRIQSPGAKNIISVPMIEFRTVWLVWEDYKSQRLRRSELGEMTRYSKYVVSILHWHEELERKSPEYSGSLFEMQLDLFDKDKNEKP